MKLLFIVCMIIWCSTSCGDGRPEVAQVVDVDVRDATVEECANGGFVLNEDRILCNGTPGVSGVDGVDGRDGRNGASMSVAFTLNCSGSENITGFDYVYRVVGYEDGSSVAYASLRDLEVEHGGWGFEPPGSIYMPTVTFVWDTIGVSSGGNYTMGFNGNQSPTIRYSEPGSTTSQTWTGEQDECMQIDY